MKVLLFYTTHRQTWELTLSAEFLRRTSHLKKVSDVIVHCNNSNITDDDLKNFSSFDEKCRILRGRNTGHRSGLHTALSESFHLFKDYDWVLHLHPDVFIVDDVKLFTILSENVHNESVHMIVDQDKIWSGSAYSTDFFAFKPDKIPNFFTSALPDDNPSCLIAEEFLYKQVKMNDIRVLPVTREGAVERKVDSLGLLHSHDYYQAQILLSSLHKKEAKRNS